MSDIPIRKEVEAIKDYIPGKNPTEPGVVKLASNENPFGPSPKSVKAIGEEAGRLQIYPDQKSTRLREALAGKLGVGPENIICGNGSDDIMQVIASTYIEPGDEVIVSKNTFSLYELVTRLFGGKLVLVDLKEAALDLAALAGAVTKKTKVIFLTNPNNPTGTIFTAAEFAAFKKKVPDNVLVVVDEAYAEFAENPDFPNSINYVKEGRNVIVLRTFSKFFGLAGLRVGYGVARPELIAPMFRTKMPFNVNRLAQAGAAAALDDDDFMAKTLQNNGAGKDLLYAELDKLGYKYKKTEANFVFVSTVKPADEVFLELMKKGVIIRPLTSFGFPNAIRVSIGTPEQNKKFLAALASC
ncbi:MAG: histidinol-phosphate transaminase [Candidatus Margulisbacteria bacterium]|jgi:histidinol-phosphate aminotransferase|nr:histidinol-phosphate transaminase [Candidatus Margulisiibacteriota bacterium]